MPINKNTYVIKHYNIIPLNLSIRFKSFIINRFFTSYFSQNYPKSVKSAPTWISRRQIAGQSEIPAARKDNRRPRRPRGRRRSEGAAADIREIWINKRSGEHIKEKYDWDAEPTGEVSKKEKKAKEKNKGLRRRCSA